MENIYEYAKPVFSTIGNDGIVEFIFSKFTFAHSHTFIEFGAHNGIHGSNTRNLLLNKKWNGLYIEPSFRRFLLLCVNTLRFPNVKCIRSFVSHESKSKCSLDSIWSSSGLAEPAFVSIDVDGIDFEIFSSIEKIKPLVYCIEGGQMLPPLHPLVAHEIASKNIQQSLSTIKALADAQGYVILCSSQDTFLIRNDLANLFPEYLSPDLCTLYEAGLICQIRRIPWISKTLESIGLSNSIIDFVLDNSNFDKYGYEKRFEWASMETTIVPAIKSAMMVYKSVNA